MPAEKIFEEFSFLLKERLSRNIETTEDSLRYTFFLAFLNQTNIAHWEIMLEFPHPNPPEGKGETRERVDTYIPSWGGIEGLAIEFKYHRQIPSGRNSPKTQKVGEIFRDIYRLLRFRESKKETSLWLVYLTDNEMAKYYRNPTNGFYDFFELLKGSIFKVNREFFLSKKETFLKKVKFEFEAKIRSLWKEEMPNQHELRVYEIFP